MARRFFILLLAVCLCLFLSGCSFSGFTGLEPRNLMAPPKSNADQQAITALLQENRSDMTFVFPKNGEYRSAIIMQDITGDGVQDAFGFYALEDPGGVVVQFLVKAEDGWRSDSIFQNTALQVDRVCFGDLTGDGVQDVIIGWGNAAGTSGRTAAVAAYCYDPMQGVVETPLGIYGEMVLTDLDHDGVSEIFTVDKFLPAEAEGDESYPARAKIYRWHNGVISEASATSADNSIASYSAASFGLLNPTTYGVTLDGVKADGSLTTQIFYWQNGALRSAPVGVNTEAYVNLSSRPSTAPFLCRDINADGMIEIPSVSLLPCISESTAPDSTSYLVTWNSFRPDGMLFPENLCLMNLVEGYLFSIPWSINGLITAANDPESRTVTYTEVVSSGDGGSPLLGSPLFTIRVFTRSSWESWGESLGYQQLTAQGDLIYGILVRTEDQRFSLAMKRIRESFRLLN